MTAATEQSEITLTRQCTILSGDVRETLRRLPAGSIHCAVTSPPYWALRSYLPAGHALKHLELGREPTPELFVQNLVGVFREVRRVLRDDGSLWVNLGDSFCSGTSAPRKPTTTQGPDVPSSWSNRCDPTRMPAVGDMKALDQSLVPHQFALAMRADGWYLRDTIVWAKPAPMPLSIDGWRWERCRVKVKAGWDKDHPHPSQNMESSRAGTCFARGRENSMPLATWSDCPGCAKCSSNAGLILRKGAWRTTTAHEYIFLFTKSGTYYGDREAVATEAAQTTVERNRYSRVLDDPDEQCAVAHDHEYTGATANLRSVWMISSEPQKEKHYACFPAALPERCLLASTSAKGVCRECGAPWARIVESNRVPDRPGRVNGRNGDSLSDSHGPDGRDGSRLNRATSTLGWRPTCRCPQSDPIPATVLDPFGGTGRTAVAALRNGRRAVLCELNPEFAEMACEQVTAANPLFADVEVVYPRWREKGRRRPEHAREGNEGAKTQ